jgi:crossover junction endodeoxyribonuclease RuvC
VKVFGIDPGSARTGYGCVQSDGSRHRLIACGAIVIPASSAFPEKLKIIHVELGALLARHRPVCVAIENLFHAVNARSALKLGHARGVAMLAAVEAGVPIVEYTPAEVKQSVVGYGRAEKGQVQSMIQLLLGLSHPPVPFDASDALAIAVCHLHRMNVGGAVPLIPDRALKLNAARKAGSRAAVGALPSALMQRERPAFARTVGPVLR